MSQTVGGLPNDPTTKEPQLRMIGRVGGRVCAIFGACAWCWAFDKSTGKCSRGRRLKDLVTGGCLALRTRNDHLRGAWRDHCLPGPFSWFLHETGLESLKITSARCFLLKCQRKDSKKAKEHRQFHGVLGRWRTAAIDRTTFHACQRCRKNAVLAIFLGFGVSFGEEKLFVTSNASF